MWIDGCWVSYRCIRIGMLFHSQVNPFEIQSSVLGPGHPATHMPSPFAKMYRVTDPHDVSAPLTPSAYVWLWLVFLEARIIAPNKESSSLIFHECVCCMCLFVRVHLVALVGEPSRNIDCEDSRPGHNSIGHSSSHY